MSYAIEWNNKTFYLKIHHDIFQNNPIIVFNIKLYPYLLYFQQLYHGHNKLEEMHHAYTMIYPLLDHIGA